MHTKQLVFEFFCKLCAKNYKKMQKKWSKKGKLVRGAIFFVTPCTTVSILRLYGAINKAILKILVAVCLIETVRLAIISMKLFRTVRSQSFVLCCAMISITSGIFNAHLFHSKTQILLLHLNMDDFVVAKTLAKLCSFIFLRLP